MKNKLQQAKDTIAKKYGYESFEEIPYTHISSINVRYENYQDIINEVAIEYNRLCNEWFDVYTPISEYEGEQLILVIEYKDGERLCISVYNDGNCFRNLETIDELDNVVLYKPLPHSPTK